MSERPSVLEQGQAVVTGWDAARRADRERCTRLMGALEGNLTEAIAIWEGFVDAAPQREDRFSAVLWLGPEASKALFGLHLASKTVAGELSELTGVPFRDTLGMTDEIDVVTAYDTLREDETLGDRARAAIARMTARRESLRAAIAACEGRQG